MDKPPGRPIVASTDSILSPLSILLEKILTPLIKNTPSFLLDTGSLVFTIVKFGVRLFEGSFLQLIQNLGTLPEGTLLVTFGVNYTRLFNTIKV
ncbi:unnamed protein product [Ranitomeya imitator]|uniref:Uncharacterized protein n=1 Tax=Ranitomeya imitator TaxID=111125 RepID=A0ABN9MD08_9NEOB|nr:unnamed protein product [Ranitomeya imitator]